MKLLEGRLHGTLIPTLEDHLDSRSILLGSPIHLTTIYYTIPILPRPIKLGSYPMVAGEQSYDVELKFWPRSVG